MVATWPRSDLYRNWLYLSAPLFFCVTSCSDLPVSSFPFPHMDTTDLLQPINKRELKPHALASRTGETYPDPTPYSEKLNIYLVQSGPSWLDIGWALQNKAGVKVGEPKSSLVSLYHGNATITDNVKVIAPTRYRVPNLASNTSFLACVQAVEMLDNKRDSVHYSCARFQTARPPAPPLLRPDSILGLLLTLGYVFIMSTIGCVTWWMRVRRHVANHKSAGEMELSCRTSTVRCSEIEERSHLNSHESQIPDSGKS